MSAQEAHDWRALGLRGRTSFGLPLGVAIVVLSLSIAARLLDPYEFALLATVSAILGFAALAFPEWRRELKIESYKKELGSTTFVLDASPAVFVDTQLGVARLIDIEGDAEPIFLHFEEMLTAGVDPGMGGWMMVTFLMREGEERRHLALLRAKSDDPISDAARLTYVLHRELGLLVGRGSDTDTEAAS